MPTTMLTASTRSHALRAVGWPHVGPADEFSFRAIFEPFTAAQTCPA
jgi:hypothetical protein